MLGRRAAMVGAPGAVLWLGCAFAGTGDPPPTHWRVAEIQAARISESSGLARSRTHEGVFWTHNDSGDVPRFFAIDADGNLLAEFSVDGADHVDWEDIAIDDAGFLYLGDVGNNSNDRSELVVYRVVEPDPAGGDGSVAVDAVLPFSYADQEKLGDRTRMNFDSEAIFWRGGALYVFTKHRSDTETTLYRLDPDGKGNGNPGGIQRLEPIAHFDLGGDTEGLLGNATAADVSPDGSQLALLTYRGIFLFAWEAGAALPTGPVAHQPLDIGVTQQAESITWDGDALVVGNEQRGLFRIPDPFAPAIVQGAPPGEP